MINDRCPFTHASLEDGIRCFVTFNIIRSAKGFFQYLKNILWLNILEFMIQFIIYGCSHDALNHDSIIKPFLISILGWTLGIRSRPLRCRIYVLRCSIRNLKILDTENRMGSLVSLPGHQLSWSPVGGLVKNSTQHDGLLNFF